MLVVGVVHLHCGVVGCWLLCGAAAKQNKSTVCYEPVLTSLCVLLLLLLLAGASGLLPPCVLSVQQTVQAALTARGVQ
jgi:hypothetical protein